MPKIHISRGSQDCSVRALTVGVSVTETGLWHTEECEEMPRGPEGFLTTLKYKKEKWSFIQAPERNELASEHREAYVGVGKKTQEERERPFSPVTSGHKAFSRRGRSPLAESKRTSPQQPGRERRKGRHRTGSWRDARVPAARPAPVPRQPTRSSILSSRPVGHAPSRLAPPPPARRRAESASRDD